MLQLFSKSRSTTSRNGVDGWGPNTWRINTRELDDDHVGLPMTNNEMVPFEEGDLLIS